MKNTSGVKLMSDGILYSAFESHVTGAGKKVMLSILKHMERNTNMITINGTTLDKMIKDTSLSIQQIRDGVSELKKYYLIEPTMLRAEYIINPTFAIKGSDAAVWKKYGQLERKLGNTEVTIPYIGAVALSGKKLELLEFDYKIVGKDANELKTIHEVYY